MWSQRITHPKCTVILSERSESKDLRLFFGFEALIQMGQIDIKRTSKL